MGHIYLSYSHPIAIYACPIPWDVSHGIPIGIPFTWTSLVTGQSHMRCILCRRICHLSLVSMWICLQFYVFYHNYLLHIHGVFSFCKFMCHFCKFPYSFSLNSLLNWGRTTKVARMIWFDSRSDYTKNLSNDTWGLSSLVLGINNPSYEARVWLQTTRHWWLTLQMSTSFPSGVRSTMR